MTRTWKPETSSSDKKPTAATTGTRTWKPETSSSHKKPAATTTGMRLIVPLQGVVQGRGGLLLGSLLVVAEKEF
ncbi:hypothetical protein ACLB2K_003822 [Fragaria x ananassa]